MTHTWSSRIGWWKMSQQTTHHGIYKCIIPMPLMCCPFSPGSTVWYIRSMYIQGASKATDSRRFSWLACGVCVSIRHVDNDDDIVHTCTLAARLTTYTGFLLVLSIRVRDYVTGRIMHVRMGGQHVHSLVTPLCRRQTVADIRRASIMAKNKQPSKESESPEESSTRKDQVEIPRLSVVPPPRAVLKTMKPHKVMIATRLLYSTPNRLLVPFLDKCLDSRISELYILSLVCDYIS